LSIGNNRERRTEAFFAWNSSSGVTSVSVIIASTLLLAGTGFVLINQTSVGIITTAFAQQEGNTTTSAGTTTMTNDTDTTTTTAPLSRLELSAQPIWDEQVRTTNIIPINETHSVAEFEGNGTMRALDTGETINMTNNGTAIGSLLPGSNDTVSSYGREHVFSVDDGDTSAITFFEIVQYNPATFEGKGLAMGVFDRNATGSLAPFNGMLVVGTHEEDPSTQATTIRLWEWENRIPLPPVTTTTITATMEESPSSLMNTTATTMTNASSTSDTNATTAAIEEEQQQPQQQQTTPTIPAPLRE
jgi:hypothetical protein